MPKTYYPISLFLLICFALVVSAQTDVPKLKESDKKWIRVQSDDGEFSIEVPSEHHYYYNKIGFSVSEKGTSSNYDLKNVRILNSYIEGTFVSFEFYEGKKAALNAIFNDDISRSVDVRKSELNGTGYSIKQTIRSDENSYVIRQYFYSKKHIYILTAGSRIGETPLIRRFVDSLQFSPDVSPVDRANSTKVSSLPITDVVIERDIGATIPGPAKGSIQVVPPIDPNSKKLILLHKAPVAYTLSARENRVAGRIVLRATFSASGYIPKIVILRELPEGLLRQALFAAIRIKFLPPEKAGKAESAVRTIEYDFSIY